MMWGGRRAVRSDWGGWSGGVRSGVPALLPATGPRYGVDCDDCSATSFVSENNGSYDLWIYY